MKSWWSGPEDVGDGYEVLAGEDGQPVDDQSVCDPERRSLTNSVIKAGIKGLDVINFAVEGFGLGKPAQERIIDNLLSFSDSFRAFNGMPTFSLRATKVMYSTQGSNEVTCCRFSPNGTRLVSGYGDGTVRLWDTTHGKLVDEHIGIHKGPVCGVEMDCTVEGKGESEEVHKLFSCDKLGHFYSWDVGGKPGDPTHPVNHQETIIGQPQITRRGNAIRGVVSTKWSERNERGGWRWSLGLVVHDFGEKTTYKKIQHKIHLQERTCCELSSSGTGVLLGYTGQVPGKRRKYITLVWKDYKEKGYAKVLQGGCRAAWSSGSDRLVTWNTRKDEEDAKSWQISLYESSDRPERLKTILLEHHAPIWCAFVPNPDAGDPDHLASCMAGTGDSGSMSIALYELTTFTLLYTLRTGIPANGFELGEGGNEPSGSNEHTPLNCNQMISLSDDHIWLSLLSSKGKAVIIDLAHGVQELIMDIFPVHDSQASPSHSRKTFRGVECQTSPRMLAFYGSDGLLLMEPQTRDLAHGKRAIDIERKSPFTGNSVCEFSGNGEVLGILDISQQYSVILWDLKEGKRYNVNCRGEHITSFAFSEDGTWMATVHPWHIGLWDLKREELNITGTWVQGKRVAWQELNVNISDETTFCSLWMGKDSMTVFVCDLNDLVWMEMEFKDTNFEEAENIAGQERRSKGSGGSRCCFFENDGKKAVIWKSKRPKVWDLEGEKVLASVPKQYSTNRKIQKVPRLWRKGGTSQSDHIVLNAPLNRLGSPGILPYQSLGSEVACGSENLEDESNKMDSLNLRIGYEYGDYVLAFDRGLPKYEGQDDKEFESDGLANELKTLYFINRETGLTTELASPMLNPLFGCAFSHDGRRIACVTHENVVRVWSPWACEGIMPDLPYLEMTNRLEKETLIGLLEEYGPAVVNMPGAGEKSDEKKKPDMMRNPDTNEMPLLMQLAYGLHAEEFDEMVNWLLEKAKKDDICIKVRLRSVFTSSMGYFGLSIEKNAPSIVVMITNILGTDIVHLREAAQAIEEFYENLLKDFMPILYDLLSGQKLFKEIGSLKIPKKEFDQWPEGVIIQTHNYLEKPIQEYKIGCGDATGILESAQVYVLLLPNAATPRFEGLLANLLLWKVDPEVYATEPVKYVIQLKWQKYAQKLVVRELIYYTILLVLYSIFCAFFTGTRKAYSKWKDMNDIFFVLSYCMGRFRLDSFHNTTEGWKGTFTSSLMWICCALTAISLLRELKQGLLHLDKGQKWFGLYASDLWNLVELASYFLLVVVIPVLFCQGDPDENRLLTSMIALESTLLWWKLLYYLQPLAHVGPVVIAIVGIIKSTFYFLFIAALILLGFSLAFFVLCRHLRNVPSEIAEAFLGDEDYGAFVNSFTNLPHTGVTLFSYALGNYDLGDLYRMNVDISGYPQLPYLIPIVFFVVFMFLMGVILLNLLIAIMGDEYNAIIGKQEIELLKARANAIHDVETMMSSHCETGLRKSLKKYVHVIVPEKEVQRQMKEQNSHQALKRGIC